MGYKIYAPKPICDSGMRALKEKGFEVSADAATVEEAADEIMKCLKKTRKAEREVQA